MAEKEIQRCQVKGSFVAGCFIRLESTTSMSGIVAIYDPHGEPEQMAGLIQPMCCALGKAGALRSAEQLPTVQSAQASAEWHVGPGFGIGRLRPTLINQQPQPVWNKDHTVCLVFYGELYSVQQAGLQTAGIDRSKSTSVAELVLYLYEARGKTFVHSLNGSFALALWDNRQKKLLVANDRYSLCPLYHARRGETHLWASSPKAILAHPAFQGTAATRVNPAALADFLCLNIPQGNETIYEGIDEAPPASLAIWENGRLRHRQYWDITFRDSETKRSTDDYVAELVHLLKQAAQRRQSTGPSSGIQPADRSQTIKAGLLLSGGHDSRVLLSVLDKDDLTAFTFGIPHCDDIYFARRTAQARRVRHIALEIEPDYLEEFAAVGIKRTEDLISCSLFHGISIYDQAAAKVNALITGSAGEDIFGHFCRDPNDAFWGEGFSIDRYYDSKRTMTNQNLKQLLTREYYESLQGLARARFHRDMSMCASSVQTNRIDYWSIRQQQRRLYNRLSSLFPDNMLFRPLYYDYDLIDFVQTIPPSKRWGEGSIYRQVLLRTAPDLARLPLTTTCGLSLSASHRQIERRKALRRRWSQWHRSVYRLSRKGLSQSTPPWLLRMIQSATLPWPFTRTGLYAGYGAWFRRELRDWVESILLDPRTLDRGYWKANALQQMVKEYQQGRPRTRQIATLISLELWHRIYLDNVHP